MNIQLRLLVIVSPLFAALQAAEEKGPALVAEKDRVEVVSGSQKVVFTRSSDVFVMSTHVRDKDEWRPLFNAVRPLMGGALFDLQPGEYAVRTNTPDRKVVEFRGHHQKPDYEWAMEVEAGAASPLIRFTVTCHLPAPLTLESPQPVVALWMDQPGAAFHLDQGPDSIYGSTGVPHCFGFPAAYLWDDKREAAVFFNMTPMRWMRPDGVARFHDVRIMTRSEGGRTGLGMHFKHLSGKNVPAGDLVVEFFLHQGVRAKKPGGMEALDLMVRTFAPLHPATAPLPLNQLTGQTASWAQVARQTMADLTSEKNTDELNSVWKDAPLELVAPQEKMVVHPSAASWDFSSVNNHLAPWLLVSRLDGDAAALAMGLRKKDALPRFYDPRSRLIRHGTRNPVHVGDLEMSWQNFFFHEETLRASIAAGSSDFNPAVAGRFLMATAGLRELAAKTGYVFPQWFDPYQKTPAIQNDIKKLGLIREPWQAGAYAHLMMQAFEMTGGSEFLTEARTAVEVLMERTDFRVRNEVYDRHYSEVAEFPLTELFGNAYGIAAAYKLYEVTHERKFLRYSRDFMNTLLRMTFWYEDESDAISRELGNLGLFYPHGGAHVATPWETSEANLMMAWALKHDQNHPLKQLLLKLVNLNRVNSFHFFPAFWTKPVLGLDPRQHAEFGQYFPIEPFYSLEGTGGHHGRTAGYMAGLALWNHWLYDAVAEADRGDVMVLNLDAVDDQEAAVAGVARNLMVFNPTGDGLAFQLRVKALPQGDYSVRVVDAAGKQVLKRSASGAVLAGGLGLSLGAMEHVRVSVRRQGGEELADEIASASTARNQLCLAYQRMQSTMPDGDHQKLRFSAAMDEYRAGKFKSAARLAGKIVGALPSMGARVPEPPLKVIEKGGGLSAEFPNLALASSGAVAFAKDDIGKDFQAAGLNDGTYGHAKHCWIGSSADNFAGVTLARPQTINRVAFGSNNTSGGIHQDRFTGWWDVQYTTDPKPSAHSCWISLGCVMKRSADGPGRVLYEFKPVENVTAVRLKVDRSGAMVDELEVYSVPTVRGSENQ